MDAEYANYYTREVMLILIREFQSPDEEMKKIVLKVISPNYCSGFVNLNWDVLQHSKRILYHYKILHIKTGLCLLLLFFNLSGGKAVLWNRWCRSKLH